jgi:hypothetical protein
MVSTVKYKSVTVIGGERQGVILFWGEATS